MLISVAKQSGLDQFRLARAVSQHKEASKRDNIPGNDIQNESLPKEKQVLTTTVQAGYTRIVMNWTIPNAEFFTSSKYRKSSSTARTSAFSLRVS